MQRPWFVLGFVLTWALSPPLWAQQPPDPQAHLLQQQKNTYYVQVEYQRCRSDVIELLVKSDAVEKRAKDLAEQNQKLTEELTALRGKADAKPSQ